MSSTSHPPIKIGVVGFGYVGRVFHLPYIKATKGLSLHAVCSSHEKNVLASYPDVEVFKTIEALCADTALDVVVIASPNKTHRPFAEIALKAGKHVVIDKPMTVSVSDAMAILSAARTAKRLAVVFQNRRWDSDFLAIAHILCAGTLGAIRHVESAFDIFEPKISDNWRFSAGEGAGRWFDLAPHLIDQALLLFGAPMDVTADIQSLRTTSGADDWFIVTLHYEQLNVVLRGSMLARCPSPRFIVHGTKGSAIKCGMDIQEAQLVANIRPNDALFGVDPDPLVIRHSDGIEERISAPIGCQRQFYTHLVEALRHETPHPVSEDQMLAVMQITEIAHRASLLKRTLKLEIPEVRRQILKENALYQSARRDETVDESSPSSSGRMPKR